MHVSVKQYQTVTVLLLLILLLKAHSDSMVPRGTVWYHTYLDYLNRCQVLLCSHYAPHRMALQTAETERVE